jgi:hypothetical protein
MEESKNNNPEIVKEPMSVGQNITEDLVKAGAAT